MNEKGRKRIVISIVLIVLGILFLLGAYEDYLGNHQVIYDSHYAAYPYQLFVFSAGIGLMIIGFGLLAYVYIKIDKYKNRD